MARPSTNTLIFGPENPTVTCVTSKGGFSPDTVRIGLPMVARPPAPSYFIAPSKCQVEPVSVSSIQASTSTFSFKTPAGRAGDIEVTAKDSAGDCPVVVVSTVPKALLVRAQKRLLDRSGIA